MPLAFFRQNTEGENRRFNVKSKLDQKELKTYTSSCRFIIVNVDKSFPHRGDSGRKNHTMQLKAMREETAA